MHIAAGYGYVKIVQILLVQGANTEAVDKEEGTPLHLAAFYGHVEIARILLGKGANRKAADYIGQTPLILCKNDR